MDAAPAQGWQSALTSAKVTMPVMAKSTDATCGKGVAGAS